jgi:cardiolipin synthase (CMP-forming)
MNKIAFLWRSLPAHERRITLSTSITLVRIVLTPVLVLLMCGGYWVAAFWFFVFAAITDMVDGALARALDQQTFLGACLDPIADKILLVSSFATLAWIETPFFPIPYWFVWLVLFKEMALVFGVIFLYLRTGMVQIIPTWLGKITTFVQICFIAWLFVCYFCSWAPVKTYWVVLLLLFCMIAASLMQYARIGLRAWRL